MFIAFIVFLVGLRLGELVLARKNEQWLLAHGGIEYGRKHYPVIVALHTAFIISLIVEYIMRQPSEYSMILILGYLLLLVFKAWVIFTLGYFWTTKIYRIPGTPLVAKGPYRYVKHPNYLIVVGEIAVIPLAFHLYVTAALFSILNAIMLTVRIKSENQALRI